MKKLGNNSSLQGDTNEPQGGDLPDFPSVARAIKIAKREGLLWFHGESFLQFTQFNEIGHLFLRLPSQRFGTYAVWVQ